MGEHPDANDYDDDVENEMAGYKISIECHKQLLADDRADKPVVKRR